MGLFRASRLVESRFDDADGPIERSPAAVLPYATLFGGLSYKPRLELPRELRDLINALSRR